MRIVCGDAFCQTRFAPPSCRSGGCGFESRRPRLQDNDLRRVFVTQVPEKWGNCQSLVTLWGHFGGTRQTKVPLPGGNLTGGSGPSGPAFSIREVRIHAPLSEALL